MSIENFSQTYSSQSAVAIPGNARDITIRVAGAKGGSGYGCGGSTSFGRSRRADFKLKQDFQARTIVVSPGESGGDGSTGAGGGGNGGGGTASYELGGNGAASPYQYACGTQCIHVGGFCYGCPPAYQTEYCGGYCNPALRDAGIQFCACCQNSTIYCTAYAGGGGGGGSSSNVYVDGTTLISIGGGGGGRGTSCGTVGANTSAITPTSTILLFAGTAGGGGGSGGGYGGGGAGAEYAADYATASGSRYVSSEVELVTDLGLWEQSGSIRVQYSALTPEINLFSVTGGKSLDGIPDDTVTFNIGLTDFTTATLVGPFGTVNFNAGDALTYDWTPIPISEFGVTSPQVATVTLTAFAGTASVTEQIEVEIFNDNIPTTNWTTSFTNLEASVVQTVSLGTLQGVDMPTTISTAGEGNFIGVGNSFSGSRNFSNGETVSLRTTTAPFNTDTSGEDGEFGKTNEKIVPVTTPSGTFNVTFQTRAPRIQEDFNYADALNVFPEPDIDLITNNPSGFVNSAQVDVDDIEVPMEIKTDSPDAQVSINSGEWQNVREI